MPITIKINSKSPVTEKALTRAFNHFRHVDETFSTYKKTSPITLINTGKLDMSAASTEVRSVIKKCQEFKRRTDGYFDIKHNGKMDPSGLVKGWSIAGAAKLVEKTGVRDYYIDAGGDIIAKGLNGQRKPWRVGIRHPHEHDKFAKVLSIQNSAIATSASYERGNHIYNPKTGRPATFLSSVTIVGPDIMTADVFATAVFAASDAYRQLLSRLPANYGAYVIELRGNKTCATTEFSKLVLS